jgi:hypothetical protein
VGIGPHGWLKFDAGKLGSNATCRQMILVDPVSKFNGRGRN